jgi:hypothetical protein
MSLFRRPKKNRRRGSRKSIGTNAWIRLDGGFALRPCKVVESSDTGVRIAVDAPVKLSDVFTLLMSRDARSGRCARIKWRRGSQIGAEFQ